MEGLEPETKMIATPTATVSKFEHDLLVILRYLLGRAAPQQALLLITSKQDAPQCLSRDCVRLVQDSLAKGTVLHLTRIGGWRNERFLENGLTVGGRVWDRVSLGSRKLIFSKHSLNFMIWLTAEKVDSSSDKWLSIADATPGDELFFALAYERLRNEPDIAGALKLRNAFANNPFCWLFSPQDFVGEGEAKPPSFEPLFIGARAAILECLQQVLAKHWTSSERQKEAITDWPTMRRVGTAEIAMLVNFLAAAEKANRTDLARFVLRSMAAVLHGHYPDAKFWTGGLTANPPTRLADRIAIQRNALAFPQQAETLARWDRLARSIGYFDDGYAASQLWKEEYESANGGEILAKSKRALDQLEPLKT